MPSTYWSGKSLERRTAMKKLLVVVILAAVALACGGGSSKSSSGVAPGAGAGAAKQTRIHFTKNYNKGTGTGQYNTDCNGIVTTEQIKADHKEKINVKVTTNNGESDDDKCDSLTDLTMVNLRFQNDVMGTAAMKKLTANGGGVIAGE